MKISPVIRAIAIVSLFGTLVLSSCADIVESRTELLTNGPWKVQSLSNPDLDATTLAFYQAFLSLVEYEYFDDGTYTVTLADTSLGSPDAGTWAFNDDASMLTTDRGTADEEQYTIVDLTKESLTYSYDDSTGTTTIIWTH